MTANLAPIYTLTPVLAQAQISVANTSRDGTGSITTVVAGSANGRRIDRINIKATVTTTAGTVRLYLDDGSNVRLWKEIAVTAITASASVPAFETNIYTGDPYSPLLVLPSSSYILKVSTEKAETINIAATGSDY